MPSRYLDLIFLCCINQQFHIENLCEFCEEISQGNRFYELFPNRGNRLDVDTRT